ncbi:MarR family winged helix-turn-helix transcriptional regulator [Actinomadura harenae]|uniref:MarR family transcriptional regulator n=1 Tax=Actinomadura harenae TaxID=2483351 RepID=A0A3M2LUM2_9ACTN|nr:MarR family transcriptional regulator [Actinomadura harenae]RMI41087.1 MarR family transcriptional regulator [Actinomadura harenae]
MNSDPAPDRSPVVEFGLTLKRAQHVLAQRLDEALRPFDLNLGLWAVLREVERQPGASASELARATFHTPQTLGGLLQRLQDRGLVERSAGRGRIVDNHLTATGRDTLATVTPKAEAVIADALTALPPADRERFQGLLADFTDALTRPRD